jgi:hypothetical protein
VRYAVDPFGHDFPAEFLEIWLRTQIARDKLMFYELGLFKTLEESRGDLRTGKYVVNELEQIYALTELEEARKQPGFIDRVKQEAAKMNPVFFQRMGRLLKSPGKKREELSGTKLQRFLLNFWAFESKDRKGQVVPPLCFFSDPAIAELANYCLGANSYIAANVRKTWQRLGLQKSKKPLFLSVKVPAKDAGGKISISQYRRRFR